ncbi:hypothetical protein [Massilia forsythiae]|uniref:hypothetical protein n=1 Tax=Massilia forsythiae TaxID=2728020 RepID=UPI001E613278|nr:hypothetical protein [Massilia forsythiae]
MTALCLTRRWPPGVFQEGRAPLSSQSWVVLTATPSRRAAAAVVNTGSSVLSDEEDMGRIMQLKTNEFYLQSTL